MPSSAETEANGTGREREAQRSGPAVRNSHHRAVQNLTGGSAMTTLTEPAPAVKAGRQRRQPKPRPKPPRHARLCWPPDGRTPGLLKLTVGKLTTAYFLTPVATDFGSGWLLEKVRPDDPGRYYV